MLLGLGDPMNKEAKEGHPP